MFLFRIWPLGIYINSILITLANILLTHDKIAISLFLRCINKYLIQTVILLNYE